ncbi:MAG: nuclear transport factor 2 family protein [Candidatus Dormibacteraeota bacterium]|nr:nuclear transport factor 2 family protein [Candidatus Dormibacteraeota bacterium]
MATASSPGRRFYKRQIELLQSRDVRRLIAEHYQPDAALISPDRVVIGAQALEQHFATYLEQLGPFRVEALSAFQESADAILFEATTISNFGRVRVYDAFSLRDGRIQHHFTGVIERL